MTAISGAEYQATCMRIRKALAGGYHYRRLRVSGSERFEDLLPDKAQ
jgi:hypothetical protein